MEKGFNYFQLIPYYYLLRYCLNYAISVPIFSCSDKSQHQKIYQESNPPQPSFCLDLLLLYTDPHFVFFPLSWNFHTECPDEKFTPWSTFTFQFITWYNIPASICICNSLSYPNFSSSRGSSGYQMIYNIHDTSILNNHHHHHRVSGIYDQAS